MDLIKAGSMPHSYKITFFGIRIRFRNIFSLKNNKIILVNEKGEQVKKRIKGLNVKFKGANATIKIYSPCPKFSNTIIECGDNVNITIGAVLYPAFSKMQDDKRRMKEALRKAISSCSFVIFPLMYGLFAIAPDIVRLMLTDNYKGK